MNFEGNRALIWQSLPVLIIEGSTNVFTGVLYLHKSKTEVNDMMTGDQRTMRPLNQPNKMFLDNSIFGGR